MRSAADDASAFVSILEASARVGVSRRTIYNWLKSGRLTYRRTAGGRVRIETTSLWRAPEPAASSQK